VIAVLRLIRYKNLIIIALTQYMMRYLIINPILRINNFELQMNDFHFLLLVLSALFITAAGYVINDYFDTRTDMLNRPEKVVVGKLISRRWAMLLHILLNIAGIGLGIYLSLYVGILSLGVAYLLAAGMLWFYSTTYKRQFLIGNLIVALFTGMVPFVVVLFEVPMLYDEYRSVLIQNHMNFNPVMAWVGGFSYFAFLSTLIREIIKDVEDYEGDMAFGRNSMPVVIGIKTTRHVIVCLIAFLLFSLFYIYYRFLRVMPDGKPDYLTLGYFTLFLLVPFIYLVIRLYRASGKDDYHICSIITKVIMLAGILYSVIACLILTTNFR
jgi:4-hydroxybenzoate polyprenyltransferase